MNPALPEGAPGDLSAGATGAWQVTGQQSYTGVPYSTLQQGTREAENPNELSVVVHLATTRLEVAAPTGTRASLQLPVGHLRTSTIDERQSSTNIGDAELRIRQTLPWLERPRLTVGLGAALPTGPYVERSGAANLPPEATFLSLGRGVSWALAEARVSMAWSDALSSYAQLSSRTPLGRAEDDFDWGSEVRAAIGGRLDLWRRLSGLAIAELQWRGQASEPDPFGTGRLASANTGGSWWTLTPAAAYQLGADVSVLGGLRIPVLSDVKGNQLVPGVGGFVSLSVSWRRPPPARPAPAPPIPAPVAGKITVIDYWATWCAPCEAIGAALRRAEPGWPDVEIVKIDASGWPDNGLELPRGADGLPVIEIYDAQRRRQHVLTGNEALSVVDIVNTLRGES